ncbi:hypothetical protein [Lacinutrix himadriensis]|uniref:hypothetical protein n=1 Tax=Lacinutrix himadriensis TaxID=641549 RepID=UPI0006E1ABCC|nr:hypothetical protein [Lacinutrix himadriensis]
MKKYISLLSLIAIFFVGMQQTQAQNARANTSDIPEVKAKQQTYELHQLVTLSGEQQGATFKLFVDQIQNLNGLAGNDDIASVQEAKMFLQEKTLAKLKEILTEKQMQVYLKDLEASKK